MFKYSFIYIFFFLLFIWQCILDDTLEILSMFASNILSINAYLIYFWLYLTWKINYFFSFSSLNFRWVPWILTLKGKGENFLNKKKSLNNTKIYNEMIHRQVQRHCFKFGRRIQTYEISADLILTLLRMRMIVFIVIA